MSDYSSSDMEDATDLMEVEKPKDIDAQTKGSPNNRTSLQLSLSKASEYLDPRHDSEVNYLASLPVVSTYRLNSGLLETLPNQVAKSQQNKTVNFNFIVAGRSGLGKSTFIKMLFPQETPVRPPVAGDTMYPVQCTQLSMARYFVEDMGVKADVSVIDTPGFGEYIDNRNCWVPICNYIDKQHMVYMYQEEQVHRSKIVDSRVNACVYFIEHTARMISEMDLTAMREISLRANLIPVIAKADCVTREELESFKKSIRAQFEANDIKVYQNMDALGVVCSNIQVDINGKLNFARTYSYGSVNCQDPRFSDFEKLRNLLIADNTLDLIDTTHNVYYRYQRVVLMHYRYRKAMNGTKEERTVGKPPLELLKIINGVNLSALLKEHLERDPLFLQQVAKVKDRYNQVGNEQTKQFSEHQMGLHAKQLDYEKELKQIRFDINDLKEQIKAAKIRQR